MAQLINTKAERLELAKQLLSELVEYPFVTNTKSERITLAQFRVGCARNAVRLYLYGVMSFKVAFISAESDIETALGLLVSK